MITLFHGLSNIGILFPARLILRARSSVDAQLPARLFFPPVFLLVSCCARGHRVFVGNTVTLDARYIPLVCAAGLIARGKEWLQVCTCRIMHLVCISAGRSAVPARVVRGYTTLVCTTNLALVGASLVHPLLLHTSLCTGRCSSGCVWSARRILGGVPLHPCIWYSFLAIFPAAMHIALRAASGACACVVTNAAV